MSVTAIRSQCHLAEGQSHDTSVSIVGRGQSHFLVYVLQACNEHGEVIYHVYVLGETK